MTESLRPRQRLGTACWLLSVLCAVFAPLPLLGVLSSTEFASDFENGTRLADYSGFPIAKSLAVGAIVFAAVGVLIGTATARVVAALILITPALLVLDAAVSR